MACEEASEQEKYPNGNVPACERDDCTDQHDR